LIGGGGGRRGEGGWGGGAMVFSLGVGIGFKKKTLILV